MQESILIVIISKVKVLVTSLGAQKLASSMAGGIILGIHRRASKVELTVIMASSALLGVGMGTIGEYLLGKFIPIHVLGKLVYLVYTTAGILSYDVALRIIDRSPKIGEKIVDKGENII